MNIFLSYASEDRDLADQVQLALGGVGHQVFFDRESLPAAGDYHARIRSAVDQSEVFVFLISPDSVAPGSYALTELKYARGKWPHPKGRVLPVKVRDTTWGIVPSYLKAVTVLEPEGNIPAEVVDAITELQRESDPSVANARASSELQESPVAGARTRKLTSTLFFAVIGIVGVVAVAIVANWEKIVAQFSVQAPKPGAQDSSTGSVAPKVPEVNSKPPAEVAPEAIEVSLDRRALAITMINETGKPRSYTSVYTFAGDLEFGQGFVSLKRGSLYTLLKTYSETEGARFVSQIQSYLPQLQRADLDLIRDEKFRALLARVAGEDPVMLKLQDETIERGFFGPAKKECTDIGIKTALGYALVADTILHSGRNFYERIKLATIKSLDGTPATGVNERRWLKRFAEGRIASFANKPFASVVKTRTETYLKLMDSGKWDLAAPVVVGRYQLIDP